MTAELLLRSQLLGTQVINQGNAARLGIVSQVWVDPAQQQVVVLSTRDQAFGGGSQSILLERIGAVGRDAILVANETAFEDLDLTDLERVVGSEVMSEGGVRLGKVKDFEFDSATGEITSLTLSSLGIPLLPGFILSTYQLLASEIKSLGRDRVLVAEGAEDRLTQISRSIFEQLGVGKAPWQQDALPPALPSSASSLSDRDEEYDERYDEDYAEEEEDEIDVEPAESVYAEDDDEVEEPDDDEEEDLTPMSPPVVDYQAEYESAEVEIDDRDP